METAKENKNKGFISHFLAIGTGTAINMLLGFISTPIITRIVEPEEYGQLGIFQMYTSIAVMVLCLGLDQSLVRFFYDEDTTEYKRSLLKCCFRLPFLITLITAAAVSFLALSGAVKFEFSPVIMVLLAGNVLANVVYRIALLVLRITYQSKKYSLCNVLYKLVYIVAALILVNIFDSNYFMLLAISTVISIVVPTVFAISQSRELWSFRADDKLENESEILKFGLPLILAMGITTLFQAIDKISLNYYCTYTEVGVYTSAMTLVNIFAIIQSTFNSLWGPMQTEHYVKNPEDTGYIQKANRMITVIMFFFGISLILVKDVFALILGAKYREAGYIMPFLIFNPIMYTISETTCAGIGVSKKSNMNIVVALGACITNIIGNTFLVPQLGCKGAAISTGISYFVFWALRTVISNHYYYVNYNIPKFLFITVLTAGYAFYNTFFEFGILSVVSYVLLSAVLLFLYRSSLKDILNMVMRFIGKKKPQKEQPPKEAEK